MHAGNLSSALQNLSKAIRDVETVLREMCAEYDALALHIFVGGGIIRNTNDTKSGKRRDVSSQLSWQQARDLGFRGDLGEWERLIGKRQAPRVRKTSLWRGSGGGTL